MEVGKITFGQNCTDPLKYKMEYETAKFKGKCAKLLEELGDDFIEDDISEDPRDDNYIKDPEIRESFKKAVRNFDSGIQKPDKKSSMEEAHENYKNVAEDLLRAMKKQDYIVPEYQLREEELEAEEEKDIKPTQPFNSFNLKDCDEPIKYIKLSKEQIKKAHQKIMDTFYVDDNATVLVKQDYLIPDYQQEEELEEQTKPNALDKQVGGSHYKQYKIQPYEFFMANQIPHHKAAIIRRILRYDHPTGKGLQDLQKIQHEVELIIQLEDWEGKSGESAQKKEG